MQTRPPSVPKAPTPILRGPLRDWANRVKWGANAPRAQERIWIDPRVITRVYTRNAAVTPDFRRRHSGMVIAGDWDLQTEPIDQSWKIAACLGRYRDGLSWEETGVYDRMMQVITERGSFDGCHTLDDVKARYAKIDTLFEAIETAGYADHSVTSFGTTRLPEGVFIHIDRDGDAIFGAIGNHRMGIARALGLDRIPAQLGVVHPQALAQKALATYRTAPA